MKQVLTHGSKWPLQPLDEKDRIKDVEEALVFSNHRGAIKHPLIPGIGNSREQEEETFSDQNFDEP